MSDTLLPEPDRIEGAPHPRDTSELIGQDRAEAEFLAAFASDRLHSGWLLTGPRGVGKATMAYRIAGFLLSQVAGSGDGLFGAPPPPTSLALPADHPDMRLIRADAHPRLHVLRRGPNERGDKLSQTIAVDRVRDLKRFFHLSAADGGRRVVIVDSVDDMAAGAANALLKELEEPPELCTLLLISHQPAGLLPTIRSRCRELRFAELLPADLARALAAAGHATGQSEALTTLSGGSVGDAIGLLNLGGLETYAELISLLGALPRLDRPLALRLAESCAGRGAEQRYDLVTELADRFLVRAARAGLFGEPSVQGAPGEARLLARLSPDDRAARRWAELQQSLGARLRHGRAVNLDPAALILDMVFKIEQTALEVAAS